MPSDPPPTVVALPAVACVALALVTSAPPAGAAVVFRIGTQVGRSRDVVGLERLVVHTEVLVRHEEEPEPWLAEKVAWTSDWVTPEGRAKLTAYGVAPPHPRHPGPGDGPQSCLGYLVPQIFSCRAVSPADWNFTS